MTETWLPIAAIRPGPSWKQGYLGIPSRPLDAITGEVKHSAEGSRLGAMAALDGSRLASWTFFIPKAGPIWQHYPLEAVTWHGGSPKANVATVGSEHEGTAGEPLTDHQLRLTIDLSAMLRDRCPVLGALPAERRVTLWEHGELTAWGSGPTACPSGRIPWNSIIAALEDHMAVQLKLVRASTESAVYLAAGGLLIHVPDEPTLAAMGWTQADVEVLPPEHIIWRLPRFAWPAAE